MTCHLFVAKSLRWHHNDHNGISNHHSHDYLLNCILGRISKKTSKLRVTGLCAGIHRRPVNSPHKWPVTQKMFPFDDVIMSLPGPRLMYCQLEQLRTKSFDFFYQNTIIFIHGYVFKHVCKMLAVLFYPQCDSISNENPGDRPTKAYEVTIQRYHKPHTDKSQ